MGLEAPICIHGRGCTCFDGSSWAIFRLQDRIQELEERVERLEAKRKPIRVEVVTSANYDPERFLEQLAQALRDRFGWEIHPARIDAP